MGREVECKGEMKAAHPQRLVVLEEQEKGKKMPIGCSGWREPRTAKGRCFLNALPA